MRPVTLVEVAPRDGVRAGRAPTAAGIEGIETGALPRMADMIGAIDPPSSGGYLTRVPRAPAPTAAS